MDVEKCATGWQHLQIFETSKYLLVKRLDDVGIEISVLGDLVLGAIRRVRWVAPVFSIP